MKHLEREAGTLFPLAPLPPHRHFDNAMFFERLYDQVYAQLLVCDAFHAARQDRKRANRAKFLGLAIGPPACGKAESFRVLTGLIHGNPDLLVQIHITKAMTARKFMAQAGSARLHGTRQKMGQPDGVVFMVIGNIDQASPDVQDLLLQIGLNGEIWWENTFVQYQNCVILMTVTSQDHESADQSPDVQIQKEILSLKEQFNDSGLIKAFDQIAVYRAMTEKDLAGLIVAEIHKLADRIVQNRQWQFSLIPDKPALAALRDHAASQAEAADPALLAELGYGHYAQGAVETFVSRPLRDYLGDGIVQDADAVYIHLNPDGGLIFLREPGARLEVNQMLQFGDRPKVGEFDERFGPSRQLLQPGSEERATAGAESLPQSESGPAGGDPEDGEAKCPA